MPEVTTFERCPKCNWSIFSILAKKLRRCCACLHEWPAPETKAIATVPSVFGLVKETK